MKPTAPRIFLPFIVSVSTALLAVVACAPSRQVKEGEPVTVRLVTARGQAQVGNVFASSPCDLRISRVEATSAKFGTVVSKLPASYDVSTIGSTNVGTSVLTFGDSTPITLSASDDWVFKYVGVGDFGCATGGGSFFSAGETKPQSVMSDNTKVPMDIGTVYMGIVLTGPSPLPSDSVSYFSYVNLHITTSTTASGSCSGKYTLNLKDGTILSSAQINYSLFSSMGSIQTSLAPLPRDTSFVLAFHQTSPATADFEIPFTTGSDGGTQTINLTAPTEFCVMPSNTEAVLRANPEP